MMDFNFLPYKLNAEITDFKDKIHYISSDNGVALYKVIGDIRPLCGIPVSDIHLYFYQSKLIAVYVLFAEVTGGTEGVSGILANIIGQSPIVFTTSEGIVFSWSDVMEFVGLFSDKNQKSLYLCYTLQEYNVFDHPPLNNFIE